MSVTLPRLDELLEGTPKLGDTDEIDAIRSFVVALRDDAETYTLLLHQVGEHLAQVHGEATNKLDAVLEAQLIPGGSTLYTSSDDSARALGTYSAVIAEIHSGADRVAVRTEDRLALVGASAERIAEICAEVGLPFGYGWNEAPPAVMPEPSSMMNVATNSDSISEVMRALQRRDECASLWRVHASEWDDAVSEVHHMRTTWRSLVDDRRTAEAQLMRTLTGTAIGEIIALAAVLGADQSEAIESMLSGHSVSGLGNVDLRSPAHGINRVWDGDGPRTSHPGLTALLGSNSGADVWVSPPNPVEVAERWHTMSAQQRKTLINDVPWVVGNLPGIPFVDRDRANRLMLEYYITHQGPLSSGAKDALAEITRIAYGSGDEPPISIVALDLSDGVPLVALGYGQLDTAEYLSWGVPGMLSDADNSMDSWDLAMRTQYEEQREQLDANGGGKRAALVAFLSYDTPNLLTVLGASSAEVGGSRLAAELDGTFATRAANVPVDRHGAIGHSYGTTTLVEAVSQVTHPLDHVTLVASAGIDRGSVSSLAELNVTRDRAGNPQIFTTVASTDKLAGIGVDLSGRLQPNPVNRREPWNVIDGAFSFESDGSGPFKAVNGHGITNSDGTGYFDFKSHSSVSVASIAIGIPGGVEGGITPTGDQSELPHLGPGIFGVMKQMKAANESEWE